MELMPSVTVEWDIKEMTAKLITLLMARLHQLQVSFSHRHVRLMGIFGRGGSLRMVWRIRIWKSTLAMFMISKVSTYTGKLALQRDMT